MNSKIRCADCEYARQDKKASDKNWTAYQCTNPDSEYHKALLNVTPNGDRQDRITWSGCADGERR